MREDILAVILFAGDAGGGNAVEFRVTLALLFKEQNSRLHFHSHSNSILSKFLSEMLSVHYSP